MALDDAKARKQVRTLSPSGGIVPPGPGTRFVPRTPQQEHWISWAGRQPTDTMDSRLFVEEECT